MAISFTYMGTKKQIAGQVAEVISSSRKGPLLDLFAGISSVGAAVTPRRHVWCNDVQHFAYSLATSIFTSSRGPHLTDHQLDRLKVLFESNRRKLNSDFGGLIKSEDTIHALADYNKAARFSKKLVDFCNSEDSDRIRRLHRNPLVSRPYRLFSITFAGGYVGLRQAADIDSLRFAMDALRKERRINVEQHRWLLLALCKALGNVSNTTGHFAQYLAIKKHTYIRYLSKRRRDVFDEWCRALQDMSPEGSPRWREGNKTFRTDAITLLTSLSQARSQPSVVYADPPYTADHYSRYYHLLDTLILYDYPEAHGKGQYRPDRFVSDFSLQTKVHSAFHNLIRGAAELGCDLVMNYPAKGLLPTARSTLLKLLRQYFRHAEVALALPHHHSSLGASKGIEKSAVTELVFYAR